MVAAYVPARALWLRAIALELERLANHLGDIGAIGNDAGFAFGLAQFSRLKEQLLRASERALGQRYLMDFVIPGGTRVDLEHRKLERHGSGWEGVRDGVAGDQGWPLYLQRYADLFTRAA